MGEKRIEFIELTNAKLYGEYVSFEDIRRTVNEITGISDIMRGGEEQPSTATAIKEMQIAGARTYNSRRRS